MPPALFQCNLPVCVEVDVGAVDDFLLKVDAVCPGLVVVDAPDGPGRLLDTPANETQIAGQNGQMLANKNRRHFQLPPRYPLYQFTSHLNSSVPTVVLGSRGVKRKWFLGETMLTSYLALSTSLATRNPPQPTPSTTSLSLWPDIGTEEEE